MSYREQLESSTVPVRITDFVHRHAAQHPDWEAAVFDNCRINYLELEQRVMQCACALLALGVKKGDRIATLSTSRLEYWIIFLATAGIGAIWLGVNPKYKLEECRYIFADSKPTLLFSIEEFEGQHYHAYVETLLNECEALSQVVSLGADIAGAMTWDQFLALAEDSDHESYRAAALNVERFDPALLVYTSGSTGRPKGALIHHYGLCFGALVQTYHLSGEAEGKTIFKAPNTRGLCYLPINHVACVADTCCIFLVMGGAIHFQQRFKPDAVLKTIAREKINSFGGLPTMLLMLIDHPDFDDTNFSSVEMIGWGGAAMPLPMAQRLSDITPNLINVYGMTETSANTTYSFYSDSLEKKCGSIGCPSPFMPCRIVGADAQLCKTGEEGELQFRGDYLMKAYFNQPKATKQAFTEDGWLHTGDVGYWLEDGSIRLVGRLSDMFKSGGYNIYPREVEILMESHPQIDMAAVVGVPDPLYQEIGVAYLQPHKNQALSITDIESFCRKNLANYKVPKRFVVSKQLPVLPIGKIDKVSLRQQALEVGGS